MLEIINRVVKVIGFKLNRKFVGFDMFMVAQKTNNQIIQSDYIEMVTSVFV